MTKEENSDRISVVETLAAAEDSTKTTHDDTTAPPSNATLIDVATTGTNEAETTGDSVCVDDENKTETISSIADTATINPEDKYMKPEATMTVAIGINSNTPVASADAELAANFPQKLTEILSNEEYIDIIHWLPHGKGFIIADKKIFAEEVLPKYFKKAKFTSFTRKLNRWNFVRITRGPEVGSYYHPNFQKDGVKLVSQMTCIGSKQPQAVKPLDPIALGVVPMGEAIDVAAESLGGVQQWQRQDHERYRLFYQQNHWNYMMQMMQQAAADKTPQEHGDAVDATTGTTEDATFPVKEECTTVAVVDDNTKSKQSEAETVTDDPASNMAEL